MLLKIIVVFAISMLIWGMAGCGDSREKSEDKSPQSAEAAIHGTPFEGSVSNVDLSEYQVIAASDFSGRLVEPPTVKMTLRISENGFVEEGEIFVRGRDRVNGTPDDFMSYRATCSSKEGKHCGSFLNGMLDIRLFDGVGFVEFRARKAQQEFSGPIRIDGRPRQLGIIHLRTEDFRLRGNDIWNDPNKQEDKKEAILI